MGGPIGHDQIQLLLLGVILATICLTVMLACHLVSSQNLQGDLQGSFVVQCLQGQQLSVVWLQLIAVTIASWGNMEDEDIFFQTALNSVSGSAGLVQVAPNSVSGSAVPSKRLSTQFQG